MSLSSPMITSSTIGEKFGLQNVKLGYKCNVCQASLHQEDLQPHWYDTGHNNFTAITAQFSKIVVTSKDPTVVNS